MDADIAELVRQDRLLEAARLSSARGDPRTASVLYERACEWREAATEALKSGDGRRSLDLALQANDDALALEAVQLLAAHPFDAERAAARLIERGRTAWAARVFESLGRNLDAARAWERASDLTRAAAHFERAGEPAQAARVLESALRRDPNDGAAAVALGVLLARFGKDEASLRALQRVPPGTPARGDALRAMRGPLQRLGFTAAANEADAELAARGDPPRASEVEPPAWLAGRYEVARQVASSAHARLLEAFDRARGARVALKVFATGDSRGAGRAAMARLERDVHTVRSLDHPAIVPIRDLHPQGPTVVLAWMDGGNLDERLREGAVPPARAAEIADAVLSALAEAHRAKVLHRDVKPSNVLFDAGGAAHLSDFGTSHALDASATVTAGDLGVLAYQSPEQREGRVVTAKSDLFAVGALLAEMLTGRKPDPIHARVSPSAAHPELDAQHDAFIASLLADAPDARPADAFHAREWLRSLRWPGRWRGGAAGRSSVERADDLSTDRLTHGPGGVLVDGWTGRRVECVPISGDVLARARVFAAADHPGSQSVLRLDPEAACLWLAACDPPGARAPTVAEETHLHAALEALHAAGAVPGSIDPARVGVDGSGALVIRF